MLLRKSKKLLILALSILMILSISTSSLAAPSSTKPTTLLITNLYGQYVLPYHNAPDYIIMQISGMYTSTNPKYQSFNLYTTKGMSNINKDLELGVNLFIDEKKGTITIKNAEVEIYEVVSYSPYTINVTGTETLNFEIKYDVTQPFEVITFKDQNYYDEESGYFVLINDYERKEWSASYSPVEFAGYIFGESRQYTLQDGATWFGISHQTLVYKQ